jgi:hypothetical protein
MPCINTYSQVYIDEVHGKIAEDVAAFSAIISAISQQPELTRTLSDAVSAFEPHFFKNLVLALDNYFVHRARALEKKDGNPLSEVRLLCNSIMNNNNKMVGDKTIKYDPAKSVLKYQLGDEIKLDITAFNKLSTAFFSEIESKYT